MSRIASHTLSATALELWRGDRCLFTELNLTVSTGELLQVTGANGSGKTSLLRVLTGLLPPEAGHVRWNDEPIHRARAAFHESMGYVAHRDAHYDDLTLRQNLMWGIGLHHDIESRDVDSTLEALDWCELADVPAHALSAGQRRRLSLARLRASGKSLWILDEPLTNLDAGARVWCEDIIEVHLEQGGSVIATSHQPLCVRAPSRREWAIST
ncbi:MAG: cytochrome c biogenesis heme-transporting ATPase CcmA [Pseudomonadota bacterium]